jgi:hypothetical protein
MFNCRMLVGMDDGSPELEMLWQMITFLPNEARHTSGSRKYPMLRDVPQS